MNFIEALQKYTPKGNNFNSLTSTFKEFDDKFGGFPQQGLISVTGDYNSKLENFTLSVFANYITKWQISNILYLNFRGYIHEQSAIKNLLSIIFDIPYNHLCNCEKWVKDDYEEYDTIVATKISKHKEYLKNIFLESWSYTDIHTFQKSIYKYVRENGIKIVIIDDFNHLVGNSKESSEKFLLSFLQDISSCYNITFILNTFIDIDSALNSILYHSNLVINITPSKIVNHERNNLIDIHVLKNDFGHENDSVSLHYNRSTRGVYSLI